METNSRARSTYRQPLKVSGHDFAFLDEILGGSPDLITLHDVLSSQIIYVNHDNFWKNLFDVDHVYEMTDEERAAAMIHEDDLEKAKAFLAKRERLADDECAMVELKMKHGIWIRVQSKVFKRDKGGNPLEILSFTTDITKFKKAEREVLELKDEMAHTTEEKYRSLFESIDEGFSLLEMIFDENGRIVDYWHREHNRSFSRMTGIQDSVGKRMSELMPHLEVEWYTILEKVYCTGEPVRIQYPVQQLNRWYTCYLSRVGDDGSPLIAAVYDDITESKRLEQNQSFLSDISKDLVEMENIAHAMEALGEKIAKYFQVPWCSFVERRDDCESGISFYGWNAQSVPSLKGMFRALQLWTVGEAAKHDAGQPTIACDTEKDPLLNAESYIALGIGSFMAVPLANNGKCKFIHTIMDVKARKWRDDEISLMKELVSRIWARMERARAEEDLQKAQKAYREQLRNEVRDRTRQLRQSAEVLEKEHHFLEQVTDKAPLLIYVFDVAEHRFTFINKQVERLIGRDQDYVYAMGPHLLQSVLHPEDVERRARYMRELATLNDGNAIREMEFRVWNGEEFRWFRSRDSIFAHDKDRAKQVIGIAEDITYEKKFHEANNNDEDSAALN